MQNLFKKDSVQMAKTSTPWFTNYPSSWNFDGARPSLSESVNATLKSSAEHRLHPESQFQDRDSSSSLSTDKSHHGAGCNESYGRHLEGTTKSSMPGGNVDYTIRQQLDHGQSMGGLSYPCMDAYYGGVLATYGPKAVIYPGIVGVAPARVPLPLDFSESEPVYVNPKQYPAILRRRQIRAKLEAQNKLVKSRKPYLHESRHLHAVKRPRGSGGRFLNSKNPQKSKPPPTNSGNLCGFDFDRSLNGSLGDSPPSGSDVTSIFSGDDIFRQPDSIIR